VPQAVSVGGAGAVVAASAAAHSLRRARGATSAPGSTSLSRLPFYCTRPACVSPAWTSLTKANRVECVSARDEKQPARCGPPRHSHLPPSPAHAPFVQRTGYTRCKSTASAFPAEPNVHSVNTADLPVRRGDVVDKVWEVTLPTDVNCLHVLTQGGLAPKPGPTHLARKRLRAAAHKLDMAVTVVTLHKGKPAHFADELTPPIPVNRLDMLVEVSALAEGPPALAARKSSRRRLRRRGRRRGTRRACGKGRPGRQRRPGGRVRHERVLRRCQRRMRRRRWRRRRRRRRRQRLSRWQSRGMRVGARSWRCAGRTRGRLKVGRTENGVPVPRRCQPGGCGGSQGAREACQSRHRPLCFGRAESGRGARCVDEA
jgi:hypothetical protein